MGTLTVERRDDGAEALARRSCGWERLEGADAALVVGVPVNEAIILGSFQRPSEVVSSLPILRRGSGGAPARVGPGSVWLALALARPDALVPCTPDKLLNRYVRPLLRALTRVSSVPASYFGRDWISAAHRPVALVAFGHDTKAGAALFEAIVAVRTPFAPSARPSFLGKEPATLEDVAGRSIDPRAVAEAVTDAYRAIAHEVREVESSPAPLEVLDTSELPWSSTREEALGAIAAGRDKAGRLRVGGELMASRDAVARLEDALALLPPNASVDNVGRAVDEALSTRGAITFGLRSLTSIRDAILDALEPRARSPEPQNIA